MNLKLNLLNAISTEMAKHTQTIRRQQPMNCLGVFDHFVGLAINGLTSSVKKLNLVLAFKHSRVFVISPSNRTKPQSAMCIYQ